MRIGIIGAGHIGGTLTRRLRRLGHEVSVANSRGPQTLAALAAETGAQTVTVAQAPVGAELLVVTIPERAVPDLPRDLLAQAPPGLVVVDTGNYYPQRDGRIEEIEQGLPESRWVERQLQHPVIKAFNTIHAANLMSLGRPRGSPDRLALPIAGDDASAKAAVLDLVDKLGFDAVDAGGLDESWRQQPGTPVYGVQLDAAGVRQALAQASRDRLPQCRAGGGR